MQSSTSHSLERARSYNLPQALWQWLLSFFVSVPAISLDMTETQIHATYDAFSRRPLTSVVNARAKDEAILYLPPLLSLLPHNLPQDSPACDHPIPLPTNETEAFNFQRPVVGFTDARLPVIDAGSVHLHNALYHFKPLHNRYATEPYSEAFNWSELELPVALEKEW